MKIGALFLVVFVSLSSPTSAGAEASPFTVVNGRCTAKSAIAHGPAGSDLRKLMKPYACDSTVISADASTGSVMFQFANRPSDGQAPIGFAGRLESPYLIKVERVYLKPGQPMVPNDGYCRLWKGEAQPGSLSRFTTVLCAAQVDQGDQRTSALVVFDVK